MCADSFVDTTGPRRDCFRCTSAVLSMGFRAALFSASSFNTYLVACSIDVVDLSTTPILRRQHRCQMVSVVARCVFRHRLICLSVAQRLQHFPHSVSVCRVLAALNDASVEVQVHRDRESRRVMFGGSAGLRPFGVTVAPCVTCSRLVLPIHGTSPLRSFDFFTLPCAEEAVVERLVPRRDQGTMSSAARALYWASVTQLVCCCLYLSLVGTQVGCHPSCPSRPHPLLRRPLVGSTGPAVQSGCALPARSDAPPLFKLDCTPFWWPMCCHSLPLPCSLW